MNRRSVRVVALVAACVSSSVLSACGGDDEGSLLARAREEGITIAIADERPYGFEEGGRATGEGPAVATRVLTRLGIEQINFEVVDFGALILGLNADRYDVIAAGMPITPERAAQVAFSDPDHCATTAFAVPAPNPRALRDFASVASTGTRLGVVEESTEERDAVDSGVPELLIERFAADTDLLDALEEGRIAAAALPAVDARAWVAGTEGFEATRGFVPVVDGKPRLRCGAFAFRESDRAFRDAFNSELLEMKQQGAILPLIRAFGFTRAEVEPARHLTAVDLG